MNLGNISNIRELLRSVTSEAGAESSASQPSPDLSFDSVLRGFLSQESGKNVNEEELFAGILSERIQGTAGEEVASRFQELLDEEKVSHTRPDGYTFLEDATNAALGRLVDEGQISQEDSDVVRSQAFRAAQLDGNLSALYDGRGSANDPTVAVAELESALASARLVIEQLESGVAVDDVVADPVSNISKLTANEKNAPTGTSMDGADGFLYKPVSESDGNLVILLPKEMAMQVVGLILKDEEGETVATGRSAGYHNGGREHFRFNKPGKKYPDNLTVEVQMKDGSAVTYTVPDSSLRYD